METKHKKTFGIDSDLARKERELKNSKLQKVKRFLKANKHRKINEDNATEGETILSRHVLRQLDEMSVALYSDDATLVADAAKYFRRVLAVDKNPPFDEVIEIGVLPRMVELLHIASIEVQFEITWSLTNLACGEYHHAEAVVNSGAVPVLVGLLQHRASNVREQALWAIGNLSEHSDLCRTILMELNITRAVLLLLNIPEEEVLQAQDISEASCSQSAAALPTPSLFTMQHSAWVCANLTRDRPLPEDRHLFSVIAISAQLLQSPDDSIISTICVTLSAVCGGGNSLMVEYMLQQGILHRLVDICQSPTDRWAAVGLICAIIKSENPLHKYAALRRKYNVLDALLLELTENSAIRVPDLVPQHAITVQICSTLSVILLESNDHRYGDCLFQKNCHVILANIIHESNFQTFIGAGRCLCYLIMHASLPAMVEMVTQVFPAILVELLKAIDMQLIVISLTCALQVLDALGRADRSVERLALEALVCISCDDDFYGVVSEQATSGYKSEIRDLSTAILALLDSVRTIHGG